MWQHSYPPLNSWTEVQIAAFTEVHPDVTIDLEIVPFEEWNEKVLTALAVGAGPHIFETDDFTFAQFLENGSLAPIDPGVFGFDSVAAFTAAHEPASLELVTVDGVIYALPYDWEAPVIGYNVELMTAAGYDPKAFRTWGELMEAAAQVSQHDNGILSTSGFSWVHNIDVYYQIQGTTLFSQAGASVLTEDGTQAAINSPEAARVFEFWRDSVHQYQVTSPGFSSTVYLTEFSEGQVGMGFMLVWAPIAVPGFEKGDNLEIALLPTFDGEPAPSASYSWNWTLNSANSPQESQAGTLFLEFLSTQGASLLAEASLINPRLGWRDEITPGLHDRYREIFESLANSRPVRPTAKFNEIWRPIIELFKAVEHDPNVDIQAQLAQVEAEIDAILAR